MKRVLTAGSQVLARGDFRLLLLMIVLAVVVAGVMYPSNPHDRLPGQDNGVFLYGGQQILQGRLPYVDFWDHKGPLIHYLNAAGLLLGAGSRWGVWALELALVVLTGFALFRAARTAFGVAAGLATLAFWTYGLYQVGPYQHFRDHNYTETYALFLNAWCVYFWLRGRRSARPAAWMLAAGMCTGLSLLLRPNNVGLQVGAISAELILGARERRVAPGLRRIAEMLVGALAVVGAAGLWFLARGGLSEMIDQVLTYNFAYGAKNLSAATALTVFRVGNRELAWLPTIGFLGMLIVLPAHRVPAIPSQPDSGTFLALLLTLGWPFEIALTVLSGRALIHYYILWLPYASLLPAMILVVLAASFETGRKVLNRGGHVIAACAVVYLAVSGVSALSGYAGLIQLALTRTAPIEATGAVTKYVANHTDATETVLVWGNDAWINFLSRRRSPTRYVYQYPLFVARYTNTERVASFLAELEANPPALIVEPVVDTDEVQPLDRSRRDAVQHRLVTPAGMQAVFDFVCQRYARATEIGGTIIYEQRGTLANPTDCR